MEAVYYFAAGFLGGIVHEVVQDNALKLPRLQDGSVLLGFLGSAVIGGFVGVIADNNILNAMFAGYVGISLIGHISPSVMPSAVK